MTWFHCLTEQPCLLKLAFEYNSYQTLFELRLTRSKSQLVFANSSSNELQVERLNFSLAAWLGNYRNLFHLGWCIYLSLVAYFKHPFKHTKFIWAPKSAADQGWMNLYFIGWTAELILPWSAEFGLGCINFPLPVWVMLWLQPWRFHSAASTLQPKV